jgi:hypothetical protein
LPRGTGSPAAADGAAGSRVHAGGCCRHRAAVWLQGRGRCARAPTKPLGSRCSAVAKPLTNKRVGKAGEGRRLAQHPPRRGAAGLLLGSHLHLRPARHTDAGAWAARRAAGAWKPAADSSACHAPCKPRACMLRPRLRALRQACSSSLPTCQLASLRTHSSVEELQQWSTHWASPQEMPDGRLLQPPQASQVGCKYLQAAGWGGWGGAAVRAGRGAGRVPRLCAASDMPAAAAPTKSGAPTKLATTSRVAAAHSAPEAAAPRTAVNA